MNNKEYNYNIITNKIPTQYIVYMATSPSGNKYIGITTKKLEIRISQHSRYTTNKSINYIFTNAIRKYGIKNINFDIIDYANDIKELKELEKYWIEKLDTYNNGYNLTLGGDGALGYKHTKEQNKNSSDRHKRYFSNPENRKKQSEIIKQSYINNPELRNINSENKKTMWENNRKQIEERYLRNGLKPFKVYSIEGNFIGEWVFGLECQRELNIKINIRRYLNKDIPYYKGYVFVYDDSNIDEIIKLAHKKHKINKWFNVYCNDIFIGSWNNQAQCMKDLNISRQTVYRCVNRKVKKTRDGYSFYYIEDDPNLLTDYSKIINN